MCPVDSRVESGHVVMAVVAERTRLGKCYCILTMISLFLFGREKGQWTRVHFN